MFKLTTIFLDSTLVFINTVKASRRRRRRRRCRSMSKSKFYCAPLRFLSTNIYFFSVFSIRKRNRFQIMYCTYRIRRALQYWTAFMSKNNYYAKSRILPSKSSESKRECVQNIGICSSSYRS